MTEIEQFRNLCVDLENIEKTIRQCYSEIVRSNIQIHQYNGATILPDYTVFDPNNSVPLDLKMKVGKLLEDTTSYISQRDHLKSEFPLFYGNAKKAIFSKLNDLFDSNKYCMEIITKHYTDMEKSSFRAAINLGEYFINEFK